MHEAPGTSTFTHLRRHRAAPRHRGPARPDRRGAARRSRSQPHGDAGRHASPSRATSSSATARCRRSLDARNEISVLADRHARRAPSPLGGVPAAGVDVDRARQPAPRRPARPRRATSSPRRVTDATATTRSRSRRAPTRSAANLDGAPYEGGGATPIEHPVTDRRLRAPTTQNIALPATGALQVTVVDESGDPIAGQGVGGRLRPEPRSAQHAEHPRPDQQQHRRVRRPRPGRPAVRPRQVALHRSERRLRRRCRSSRAATSVVVSHGPEYSIDDAGRHRHAPAPPRR